MFRISLIVVILFLFLYAIAGMAIGALTGLLFSIISKLKPRAIFKDGLFGAVGFLVGFFVAAFLPWPRNTVSYYVGDTLVTSTMNRYQHPEWVACAVAVLLPLTSELLRLKRSKIKTTEAVPDSK